MDERKREGRLPHDYMLSMALDGYFNHQIEQMGATDLLRENTKRWREEKRREIDARQLARNPDEVQRLRAAAHQTQNLERNVAEAQAERDVFRDKAFQKSREVLALQQQLQKQEREMQALSRAHSKHLEALEVQHRDEITSLKKDLEEEKTMVAQKEMMIAAIDETIEEERGRRELAEGLCNVARKQKMELKDRNAKLNDDLTTIIGEKLDLEDTVKKLLEEKDRVGKSRHSTRVDPSKGNPVEEKGIPINKEFFTAVKKTAESISRRRDNQQKDKGQSIGDL
ncbi:MAG: hypothetical protein ACFB21_00160 [Opitutales bacterium]